MDDVTDNYAPLMPEERARHSDTGSPAHEEAELVFLSSAEAPQPPRTNPNWGSPTATWVYLDATSAVLQIIYRFELPGERKQFSPCTLRRIGTDLRWRWKALPAPRPLYGLDRLAANPGGTVVVCEGEKATDAAQAIFPDFVAVTSSGGSGRGPDGLGALEGASRCHPPRQRRTWYEVCEHGRRDVGTLQLRDRTCRCRCARRNRWWQSLRRPKDGRLGRRGRPGGWQDPKALRARILDLAKPFQPGQALLSERAVGKRANSSRSAPAYAQSLKVLDGGELLTTQFPPRSLMLTPWLPEKGLAMIFAPRGVGKTWIALGIAHAVASGGDFLGWRAARPRSVLYIDGEMPAQMLQERYRDTVVASGQDGPAENFRLLASDFQPDGLPDLADFDEQRFLESAIGDAELIVVDNLSTVARGLRENEADAYVPFQFWLLAQRAAGRSVLLVHHAGKGGGQRGTSKKEDVLDTVISLTRPPGYEANEGARFEVRFTKSRGFFGDDAEPFEARFADGHWSRSEITAPDDDDAIAALHAQGLSVRDISARTGVPKSTVGRRLRGTRNDWGVGPRAQTKSPVPWDGP